MTREGCAVSHGNCLVEIASSLLSCRHGYLLTPTPTLTEANANATCSYEELMNMQIVFIPATRACVREHGRNAGDDRSNLGWEVVSYDDLAVPF